MKQGEGDGSWVLMIAVAFLAVQVGLWFTVLGYEFLIGPAEWTEWLKDHGVVMR